MNARVQHRLAVRTACPYCGVGCGLLASPGGRSGATISGDPEHPADRRKQKCFSEHLLKKARTWRSQCTPNRIFSLALQTARQEQAGHVPARDEEDKHYHAK